MDAASSLAEVLRLHGHDVTVENSATAALETAAKLQPDAVVLDLKVTQNRRFHSRAEDAANAWRRKSTPYRMERYGSTIIGAKRARLASIII